MIQRIAGLIFAGSLLRAVYFLIPQRVFSGSEFPIDVKYGEHGFTLQYVQYLFFFATPNVRGDMESP